MRLAMKKSMQYIIVYILIVFVTATNARTRCVRVKGSVNCATNMRLNPNIEISLWDRDDLPWETDDLMGHAKTDLQGAFTIDGCGYDFGLWNDPEPFIVIEHGCPSSMENFQQHSVVTKQKTLLLQQTFLPNEVDVGEVRLDLETNP